MSFKFPTFPDYLNFDLFFLETHNITRLRMATTLKRDELKTFAILKTQQTFKHKLSALILVRLKTCVKLSANLQYETFI